MIQQITRAEQCPTFACFRRRHEDIIKGSGSYPAEPGARMSMDEWGPYPPDSMKNRYCHSFYCGASEYIFVVLAKDKRESLYQAEYDFLQFNKGVGNKIIQIRVDAGGGSKESAAVAADFGATVNPCDKERQSRNPVETTGRPIVTLAAVQLVEAVNVSNKEWGAALLHSFDFNNAFPNERYGTMSPLEIFTGWRPDISKWHKFGTVGTAEELGYAKKFDQPNRIVVWVEPTKKPGIGDYSVIKGERRIKRVTNFQPLTTVKQRQTASKTERLLKEPFPTAGGTEVASPESLQNEVRPEADKLAELLEAPYNSYLKIQQPYEPRVTRSSTTAAAIIKASQLEKDREVETKPDSSTKIDVVDGVEKELLDKDTDSLLSNEIEPVEIIVPPKKTGEMIQIRKTT